MALFTCNRVNSKSDILSLLPQVVHHFSDGILGLSNAETVTWDNDDVLGVGNVFCTAGYVHLSVCASDLHGLATSVGLGTNVCTAQDDVSEGPVHGLENGEKMSSYKLKTLKCADIAVASVAKS